MKTSMKILAASMALAMSGVANAAILQSDGSVGSGEMFLTAWDKAGQQSYSLDLGILEADFVANPSQTLHYNLSNDPNFANFMGNSGVVYTVTGGDDSLYNPITGNKQDPTRFGFVSTSSTGAASVKLGAQTFSMIAGVVASIDNMALNSNADAGDMVDPSLNLSSYSVPGDAGYFGETTWSNSAGGSPFNTTGMIDDPNGVAVYYADILFNSTNTGFDTRVTELPNVWKLTSAGDLSYVSAVPVPAAVWLFGSGLLGLVSVARRRKV